MFYQDARTRDLNTPTSQWTFHNMFIARSRRSEFRVNIQMPCWINFKSGSKLKTRTIDISYRGASLENLSIPVEPGLAVWKCGMKLNNQSSEIVREGMIVWMTQELISRLDTTPEQKTMIRQELEFIEERLYIAL